MGHRTFLRWRFRTDDDRVVTAVRAVDTATHPDYRRRGILRRLTLQGVAELTMAGDGIVFSTSNDASCPGYLTMGWTVVRRLPVGVLPSGPRRVARMAASWVPAALWSETCSAGFEARDVLTRRGVAEALLQYAANVGFRTDRTPEHLAWRTGFEPPHYRLLLTWPQDPAQGGIIFRLRRRGASIEAVIPEQLVPDRMTCVRLVTRILREMRADYAIGLLTGPSVGLLPLPGQRPVLTVRPLAATPPPRSDWTLALGTSNCSDDVRRGRPIGHGPAHTVSLSVTVSAASISHAPRREPPRAPVAHSRAGCAGPSRHRPGSRSPAGASASSRC